MTEWWRTKARDFVPEMAEFYDDPEETIYLFFGELTNQAWLAIKEGKIELAERIFGFAEACHKHTSEKDVWNAAGVSFYEHIFDSPGLEEQVAPYIKEEIIDDLESLLTWKYGKAFFLKIRAFYE